MALQTEIRVDELACFVAGDFMDEWLNPHWAGTLEPSPNAGETMRYMLARWAYHVRECGGGKHVLDCVSTCDAHTREMRAGGPVQYVQLLAKDMRENGWQGKPIEAEFGRRRINDGHHRILAAIIAGLEAVPVVDYFTVHPYVNSL